jgi:hypothetical protein
MYITPTILAVFLLVFIFSLVVTVFLLFDYSEIGEILRLQYSSQVVLVSYPERVIRQTQLRVIVFNTHMSARQLLCRDNKSQPPPDLQRRSALNVSYSLTSPIC